MKCPACTTVELTDGLCRVCGGAWLDEAAVRARSAKQLDVRGVFVSKRFCPTCGDRMHSTLVFDVEVDRCNEHGMWFDKAELEKVMERSTSDEWRLYTGGQVHPPVSSSPLTGLLDAIDAWRMRRKKHD